VKGPEWARAPLSSALDVVGMGRTAGRLHRDEGERNGEKGWAAGFRDSPENYSYQPSSNGEVRSLAGRK